MVVSRRVRISSKGQLVIPQEMRESLGLGGGDELVLHLIDGHLLVAEVPGPSPFEQAFARLEQEARERGITRKQVEAAVAEVRQEMHRERRAQSAKA